MALFILSSITLNHGLHYVLLNPILIKYGYLNWRAISMKKISFITNRARPFLLPKSSFWIHHLFWMNFQFSITWWNNQVKKWNEALSENPKKGHYRAKLKVAKVKAIRRSNQEASNTFKRSPKCQEQNLKSKNWSKDLILGI